MCLVTYAKTCPTKDNSFGWLAHAQFNFATSYAESEWIDRMNELSFFSTLTLRKK